MRVFCISQHISLAPCDLNCSYISERRSLCEQSTGVKEGTLSALLMCSVCLRMLPEPASKGLWKKDIQSEFAFSFLNCCSYPSSSESHQGRERGHVWSKYIGDPWRENWQLVRKEAILLFCPLLQELGLRRAREQVISELETQ